MARICFVLLAHKDPDGVVAQARRLASAGDFVAIHYDRNAPAADFARLSEALAGEERILLTRRRRRCGWGEWSLVAATLATLGEAGTAFPRATHFYMLSGDCMPVKSAEYVRDFLDREDVDYIETHDFHRSGWIKTGLKDERLSYRHWFNERSHPRLFYASLRLQQRLGLRRAAPADLQIMIGSQWWCLRRRTVEQVLAFCAARRDVMRFFRTTWIPDETFFQTIVAHLVPRSELRNRTLTFLVFSDYGMPATFCNDHHDFLVRQDHLFARKISAEARDLRHRLGQLWQQQGVEFAISNDGARLYRYLTSRGRVGRRFAPRFWEAESRLGRDRVVHLIVAKKWHVGKRLAARIASNSDIPAFGYVFDELDAGLPDLGGLASTMAKRHRHRRALLRLLFEDTGSSRIVLCVDPARHELIADFCADRAQTRLLFVETELDDAYILGHMRRIGLSAPGMPAEVERRLIPVVRSDVQHEVEQVMEMELPHLQVIAAHQAIDRNTGALARFLDVSPDIAHDLANAPDLFAD